jgi:hypothetical protein
MLCITSSERKKVILLCSLFLSDSLIATWPLMVKELDLIYLYDCTFVKLLAPKRASQHLFFLNYLFIFSGSWDCAVFWAAYYYFLPPRVPIAYQKIIKKGQKY